MSERPSPREEELLRAALGPAADPPGATELAERIVTRLSVEPLGEPAPARVFVPRAPRRARALLLAAGLLLAVSLPLLRSAPPGHARRLREQVRRSESLALALTSEEGPR